MPQFNWIKTRSIKDTKQGAMFGVSLVLFFCLVKNYLAIFQANLDLLDGRFVLFMDEQTLYDGVKNILYSENLESFLYSVFDAGRNHYGRIYWNINAIIGFLPEEFFGQPGLIFSGRASGVLFLSLSIFLLSISFLKSRFFQLIAFFVLINTPFSSYFMTMPKPEPLQMFFLSLFLYFLKKNNFSLTSKGWFFFGLAAGTKVSILPLFFPIVFFSTYQVFLLKGIKKTLEVVPVTIGYLLFGFSVAVPVLVKPCFVSFLAYGLANKFFFKKRLQGTFNRFFLMLSFLAANVFYSVFAKRFFNFKTGLYKWFTQTILNTGHGFDRADIGFFTWVKFFFTEFVSSFPFVNVILFLCGFWLVLLIIKNNRPIYAKKNLFVLERVIFLLSGMLLVFVVFLTANRIWGYYLFPGFLLFVVNLISVCESVIFKDDNVDGGTVFGKKTRKKAAVFFLAFLLCVVTGFWFPQHLKVYKKLAARTKTEEYKKNHMSFLQINEALTTLSEQNNRKINVKNVGSPFVPDNNELFHIIGLERPFTRWWAMYEILLVKDVQEVLIKDINPNHLNYDERVKEIKGYDKWVILSGEPCLENACYKKIKTFENGTELLILVYRDKIDVYQE